MRSCAVRRTEKYKKTELKNRVRTEKQKKLIKNRNMIKMIKIKIIMMMIMIIMTDREARKEGIGGEVLAYVW